jgi:hypothetical protein
MGHSDRVPAADVFFLYVESPVAAQQVGGLVLLDADGGAPTVEAVAAVIRSRLAALPRFRQRLEVASRWRRARWVEAAELDWSWHVAQRRLPGGGGRAALHRLVAELQAAPLPRDRPLWRLVVVPEVDRGRAAAILIVHHVVADGVGVVRQALRLLEPAAAAGPAGAARAGRRPVRTALAVAGGLVQLVTDGRARRRLPASGTPARRFGTTSVPLVRLRAVARRHGARITEVLLSAVAGGLHRVRPDLAAQDPHLRTIVPLMVRDPTSPAEGNLTAAVMLDVPLGALPEPDRLAQTVRHARRLHSGTRAAASHFVVRAAGLLLPPPVHAWFARTVYGGRYFQAIVSNMPGPDGPLSLAGSPLRAAYPIVPLAPGSPLAVGALGWNGVLHIGISADPALLADAGAFGAAVLAVVDELAP